MKPRIFWGSFNPCAPMFLTSRGLRFVPSFFQPLTKVVGCRPLNALSLPIGQLSATDQSARSGLARLTASLFFLLFPSTTTVTRYITLLYLLAL